MRCLLILILVLVFCFCGEEPVEHKVTIIGTYQEEVNANDGKVEHDWKTIVELENGSRAYLHGKYGEKGDTFIMLYYAHGGWQTKK